MTEKRWRQKPRGCSDQGFQARRVPAPSLSPLAEAKIRRLFTCLSLSPPAQSMLGQADRQTDRQTNTQTHKQTHWRKGWLRIPRLALAVKQIDAFKALEQQQLLFWKRKRIHVAKSRWHNKRERARVGKHSAGSPAVLWEQLSPGGPARARGHGAPPAAAAGGGNAVSEACFVL